MHLVTIGFLSPPQSCENLLNEGALYFQQAPNRCNKPVKEVQPCLRLPFIVPWEQALAGIFPPGAEA